MNVDEEEVTWDQDNLSGFFELLLKIDMRQNPELYAFENHD